MPQPFHICFTFFGDMQYDSRLFKCAKTLSSGGYRVSAVTVGVRSQRSEHSGISVISIPVPPSSSKKFQFLSFYLKALRPTIQSGANCYFASDLYSLPLAYVAARFRHARLLYDSRELYSAIAALRRRKLMQRFWSYIERRIIPSAHVVFTVNDALADIIAERYHISKPTTLLNCPPRQEIQKSDRLRELLSIPSDKKIILYQGGLQEGRGIFVSLSAIKKIDNAVLVFLGEGNLRDQIVRTIEQERLHGRVFLLEAAPVSELLHYTAGADIGLCLIENYGTSYYHSLPNKLFEYVAAGIPVVASSFPEIRRFVESNGVGICVNPEDKEEVESAVRRILTDPDLYKTLLSNCIETSKRYTWEKEGAKLVMKVEELKKL